MSGSKYEIVVNLLWKMAEEDDYIDLISPKKATSSIWKYFGHPVYMKDGNRSVDSDNTRCKLCKIFIMLPEKFRGSI